MPRQQIAEHEETIMEMEPTKDDLEREAKALLIEVYGNEWQALHEEGYGSEHEYLEFERKEYQRSLTRSVQKNGKISGTRLA